jgi:hypothetical protein
MWEFENDEYFHLGRKEGQKAVLADLTAVVSRTSPITGFSSLTRAPETVPTDGSERLRSTKWDHAMSHSPLRTHISKPPVPFRGSNSSCSARIQAVPSPDVPILAAPCSKS